MALGARSRRLAVGGRPGIAARPVGTRDGAAAGLLMSRFLGPLLFSVVEIRACLRLWVACCSSSSCWPAISQPSEQRVSIP